MARPDYRRPRGRRQTRVTEGYGISSATGMVPDNGVVRLVSGATVLDEVTLDEEELDDGAVVLEATSPSTTDLWPL